MAEQIINLGNSPNDGTGDKLRIAFTKVDQNFGELYDTDRNTSNTVNRAYSVANAGFGKANNALANVSNVTFAGNLYFPNTALVSIGTLNPQVQFSVVANNATQVALPGGLIDGTGNTDLSIQLNIRNNNPGINASSDIIATNDDGIDYIDMGICSSYYGNPDWSISGPGDGYLFVSNNTLAIGTLGTDIFNNSIKFFAAGQLAENEIARFQFNSLIFYPNVFDIPNTVDYAGEKIVVWNNDTANVYNYSIGVQQDAMWFGVDANANSNTGFIWYQANTKIMELGRNALLVVNNSIAVQNLKGPYANDSSASSNGVRLKEFYYDSTGVVRIRLV